MTPQADTWQSVKGTMLHRAALAPASQWVSVRKQAHRSRFREISQDIAHHLVSALKREDFGSAAYCFGSPHPHGPGPVSSFRKLEHAQQTRVLDRFEACTQTIVDQLLTHAAADMWQEILSEVTDPYALLRATEERERTAARKRIDLIVSRVEQPPLLVELKTGAAVWDSSAMTAQLSAVVSKYGSPTARSLGKRVEVRILHVTFAGDVAWSDIQHVDP